MAGMLSDAPVPATAPARSFIAVRRLVATTLDLLLPQRCVVCSRFGAALHRHCLAALPAAGPPRCTRCWRPSRSTWCELCAEFEGDAPGSDVPQFDGLRAPYRFEGFARRALLEAKFRGVTALLEPLAVEAASIVPPEWRVDLVTPIPLTPRRERRRGFNQAQIAARHVAAALALPLADPLRRIRDREPQAALGAEQRARNLEGVFAVPTAATVEGRRMLLVDDVTTTGTTLSVAARVLHEAGAEAVFALALARED
jgi:ComF family protein